jgi:hypothetical protein
MDRTSQLNVILISTENWILGDISKYSNLKKFQVIKIPRIGDLNTHIRNSPNPFLEIANSIPSIKKELKSIPNYHSIIFFNHATIPTTFGLDSLLQIFVPNLVARVYIQKNLISDIDESSDITLKNRLLILQNLFRILYLFFRNKLEFSNTYLLIFTLLRFGFRSTILENRTYIFCFSQQELKRLKVINSAKVKLIKNFLLDSYRTPPLKDQSIEKSVYFFTSGVFKYENSKRISEELNYLKNSYIKAKANDMHFFIKPKSGELHKLKLLLGSEIPIESFLSTDLLKLESIPDSAVVICSINSTVFLESVLTNTTCFFYEIEPSKNKHLLISELASFYPDLNTFLSKNTKVTTKIAFIDIKKIIFNSLESGEGILFEEQVFKILVSHLPSLDKDSISKSATAL